MDRQFRVVTHRNWLAQHFSAYGAVQDFGFDIDPATAEDVIWWAPGAWVACVYQSGIRLPLTLCGHRWMETLPWQYKRRTITVAKVQDITDGGFGSQRVHVKLPEAKLDSFPATIFERKYLASTLKQFHVPADTLIQMSDVVPFTRECRFWIAHGKITAHSWYYSDGLASDHPDFTPGTDREVERMAALAERLLADVECPPGFTLDIGLTDELSPDSLPLVVEANAAWSSSPYDGDPAGIVQSIVASHDFDGTYPRWRWRPNPVYGLVQPIKWAKPIAAAK